MASTKHAEQEFQSSFDQLSEDLRKATLAKIKLFDSIRGKQCDLPFWDVVVITAIDGAQKQAYERQITEKLERKELPLGVDFHVISDPIGPKVGNGGSTIVVAEELEKIYKEKVKGLKVLILHAGGFSQRLPSGSLLGKIFMALPMGNPIYQALELKLAMYIEFPQRMPPGMFITSADTIELYVLDGDWTFMNSGFTAMAHPSPIEIGTTHGVFVLDDTSMKTLVDTSLDNNSVQNGRCRKFIHKPTREYMHSSGAVFQHNGEDYVYSDSAFFVDYETVKILLDWKKLNGHLSCEIDAYGDFLQALGPEGTIGYCNNVKNVTLVEPTLVKTREEVFNLLRSSQLNVLMLNKSKFYHIGTTLEYIHHFCEDLAYRYEMACSNVAMIKNNSSAETSLNGSSCVLHTYMEGGNEIGQKSVVEYSWLGKESSIGDNSIVSNVFIPDGLQLPSNIFFHTVCVKSDHMETRYVTVVFGIGDNLKKVCPDVRSTSVIKFYDRPFERALELLGLSTNPWPQDCLLLNIWHARLFPALLDPRQSVNHASKMIQKILSKNEPFTCNSATIRLYSMADILKEKDIEGIFRMRSLIRKAILE